MMSRGTPPGAVVYITRVSNKILVEHVVFSIFKYIVSIFNINKHRHSNNEASCGAAA